MLASSGRFAMWTTVSATSFAGIRGSAIVVPLACIAPVAIPADISVVAFPMSIWPQAMLNARPSSTSNLVMFPQAVPSLFEGEHTAIPRMDRDLNNADFVQAMANTAGFHFATIEQGGNSLYPSMAQRATSVEVLRILISIGPTETMHFQTWQDKAGNAIPLNEVIDPMTGVSVTFPNLAQDPREHFTANLIMPEPCPFLRRNLPACSIIRPTETEGIAMDVVKFLIDMGLFKGQPPAFFALLNQLAADADAAKREGENGD
jgi:hypothetical protein